MSMKVPGAKSAVEEPAAVRSFLQECLRQRHRAQGGHGRETPSIVGRKVPRVSFHDFRLRQPDHPRPSFSPNLRCQTSLMGWSGSSSLQAAPSTFFPQHGQLAVIGHPHPVPTKSVLVIRRIMPTSASARPFIFHEIPSVNVLKINRSAAHCLAALDVTPLLDHCAAAEQVFQSTILAKAAVTSF